MLFVQLSSLVLGLLWSMTTMTNVVMAMPQAPSPPHITKGDWVSLADGTGMEFQRAPLHHHDHLDARQAAAVRHATERLLKGSTSQYENQFIDGTETYYNDYSQAWRLLGFYIDCNAPKNNYNECGGERDGGGGGDGSQQASCQRFLMWAAYIDLNYSGGGLGEYQFYDRTNDSWDTSSCKDAGGRCAKMDCHLKDTSFTLLGFFKEPNFHEWMEQLFKHQGVCLWSDEEYNYMQTDRKLWPCECSSTGEKDEKGNTLYYDSKPMPEGRIGLGLYTDSRCSQDYMGSMDIETVLSNLQGGRRRELQEGDKGDVYSLEEDLSYWNSAFDVFKVCQPCKAYNLGFNKDLNGDREGGDQENGGEAFDCYDDAGYTDVNQCMKFRTKTEMLTADFRDIMLAHQQGNIVQVEVLGTTYGYGGYRGSGFTDGALKSQFSLTAAPPKPNPYSMGMLAVSSLVLVAGLIIFFRARSASRRANGQYKEPLVAPTGEMS